MRKQLLLLALPVLACATTNFFATPIPTFNGNAINTFVAGTANAASTQTQMFITPSATPTPSSTPTLTPLPPTFTPTMTVYERYTIEYLRARTYDGGEVRPIEIVKQEGGFTTYLAKYKSDGLNIYTLVTIPNNENTHPVIIALHGYVKPSVYNIYKSATFGSGQLVKNGYIVFQPAMRNYPPSDNGDNLFRVGHAVDVLNLIAAIKTQSGRPGLLQTADAARIGLEGGSAGGGIVLRVLTVSADVKAAVLLSSISGDERRNVPFFYAATHDPQFNGETGVPKNILAQISPSSYYSQITAPVSLAHGIDDVLIPLEWAEETCAQLESAGVEVTCNFYPASQHSFTAEAREKVLTRMIAFYKKHLR